MSYIGSQPATNFETVRKQVSTTNSGTTITLDYSVSSVQDILVTVNAVVQSYDNYSVSGTTLTLGGTLNNDRVEILYVGRTFQTVVPAVGTVTNDMLSGSIANSKLATDPLNASNLASGTVPTARLGNGTASSSTVLFGDQTFKTAPSGALEYLQGSESTSTSTILAQNSFVDNSKYVGYKIFFNSKNAGNGNQPAIRFRGGGSEITGNAYRTAVTSYGDFGNETYTFSGSYGVLESDQSTRNKAYEFTMFPYGSISNSMSYLFGMGISWKYNGNTQKFRVTNLSMYFDGTSTVDGIHFEVTSGFDRHELRIYGIKNS
jgi:hypothetical protein